MSNRDRTFAEYVSKLGYIKPIRCKDCGCFIVTEGFEKQGFCSYFKRDVPNLHYCSYAWIDEDED